MCFDLAQRLKARGHDVRVLTSDYRRGEVQGLEEGVYRWLALKRGWNLPATKDAQANPATALNTLRVQRRNVRIASRVMEQFGPDVVMFWNADHLGYGIVPAAEARANTFYYLLDTWLAPMLALQKPGRAVPVRVRAWKRALVLLGVPGGGVSSEDHLLFCSRALREEYRAFGAEVSRGKVLYLGVDTGVFSRQPQHILSREEGEARRILYSGQIVPHKGVSTLVEAFGRVRSMPGLENTRLSLLGSLQSEEYGEQLRGRMSELGVEGAVEFLPRQPREKVPEVYAAHDVLAFTSEWQEPFALSLLEAMATGLPVVSSLTGGSAEIVEDGVNALAFQAGNAEDLAAKLGWALTHPQEMAAMGSRASDRIVERYTLEAQVEALEGEIGAAL